MRCNVSHLHQQYDWLGNSKYSSGQQKYAEHQEKQHGLLYKKLNEVKSKQCNPVDDKEIMVWLKSLMNSHLLREEQHHMPSIISCLQKSSLILQKMTRETISALNRRDSILSSCQFKRKGTMGLTLPFCLSFPKEIMTIVRLIPGNSSCCDCGVTEANDKKPLHWACVTYGVILCKGCADQRITKKRQVSFVSSHNQFHLTFT